MGTKSIKNRDHFSLTVLSSLLRSGLFPHMLILLLADMTKKSPGPAPWPGHVVSNPQRPFSSSRVCSEAWERHKTWDINQAPINNGRTSLYISVGLTDNKNTNKQRLDLIYCLIKTDGSASGTQPLLKPRSQHTYWSGVFRSYNYNLITLRFLHGLY